MADNKFFSSPSVDVIEKSTKIIGNIFSKADFRIDGEVEGNITTSGKVVVEIMVKFQESLTALMQIFQGIFQGILRLMKHFL